MATNQEVIDRALYELGYLEYGDNADATDAADALTALNSLMHEWGVSDKDLNWFTQDTLTENAPIPDWAEKGVISNLAIRLGTVFDVRATPGLVNDAVTGEQVITRTLINQGLDNTDMSHLPYGQGRIKQFNIETD